MCRSFYTLILIAGALVSTPACTQTPLQRLPEPVVATPNQFDDLSALAGEWEYEDGAVVMLRLDEQGNGTYAWKDGRFKTLGLSGSTWHGMWYQEENDREGGFTIELSPDFSEGEGRWWYTRIGQDRTPSQKGGTFHMTRILSQARSGALAIQ
ncbi:MAG TPA: hypothetical protein VFS39_07990 [Nitrospira sp.]|nr:hypothetical protein [Nitrospira sp.]